MYASYPDVTADDFLYVQTDTTYRKVWDKSAITLEVVDNDPVNNAKSQVIYWEMLWPVSIRRKGHLRVAISYYKFSFRCRNSSLIVTTYSVVAI